MATLPMATRRSTIFQQADVTHSAFTVRQFNPVPEPATYALMAGGMLVLGVLARRRRVR